MNSIKGLYHIIFISFRPDTADTVREDIHNRYQRLGDECGGVKAGILLWKVEKNLDLRKGIHLVEFAIFKDKNSFEKFKKHPSHQELLTTLRETSDWQVGDFLYQ